MSEKHMETAQLQTESRPGLGVGQSDEIPPPEVTRACGHLKNNNCFVRSVLEEKEAILQPHCRVHTLSDPVLRSELHISFSLNFLQTA